MSEPRQNHAGKTPPATAEPTLKVARPPIPGRAVRAEVAAGTRPTPPIRHDEPTVALPPRAATDPNRTMEFRGPAPVKVTVGPRPRPRRRHRTWPWIAAVVLALIALGITLLVMMSRGATIDGDTDLIGSASHQALLVRGT
jgi:hypothetical protein